MNVVEPMDEILKKIKNKEINCEQALEELANNGYCPNLFNDDNGHWAISFTGYQTVCLGDDPEDVSTTSFIKAKDWKGNIYDALIWALEN